MGSKGECLLYVADRWNSLQHRCEQMRRDLATKSRRQQVGEFSGSRGVQQWDGHGSNEGCCDGGQQQGERKCNLYR